MSGGLGVRRSGGQVFRGRMSLVAALLCLSISRSSSAQDAVSAGRAAARDAAIRIFVVTGSLRVTAWDRDSVSVKGRVDPAAGRFFLGGTQNALKLGVEVPAGKEPDGTSDLDVNVPAGARLWIKSTAADVEVTAAGGAIVVNGTSGRIRVAGTASE
ncbi:MAG TPA: hypothetical protein VLD58_15680, partial [Gemmatimonadales bacterium]|nr:hypothetical protein [Gemmatimonadales bacterium]